MTRTQPTRYRVNAHLTVGPHPCRHGHPIDTDVYAFWEISQPSLVIDLTSPREGHGSYTAALQTIVPGARRVAFPIVDMSVPNVAQMYEILDAIDTALTTDATIYLHCAAGIGRSGMVIAAWHMRQGMTYDATLAHIRVLRAQMADPAAVPESAAQRAFLVAWTGHINTGGSAFPSE